MEMVEKAELRIRHLIKHNEDHKQSFESFAVELEAAGKEQCAREIRKMVDLMAKGSIYLDNALQLLA